MGAGCRVFDLRLDQLLPVFCHLLSILVYGVAVVVIASHRTRVGRPSLYLAFAMFISSSLATGYLYIASMKSTGLSDMDMLAYFVSMITSLGGMILLIIGLRGLLQRTDLLESLQEETLDGR